MGWMDLCRSYSIPWEVKHHANIRVHCPFCGPSDAGKNMSLHVNMPWWRCWREPETHRGRSPIQCIMKLLCIDENEAKEISEIYFPSWRTKSYDHVVKDKQRSAPVEVKKPNDFVPFSDIKIPLYKAIRQKYANYLLKRRYDLDFMTERYQLHWSESGPYAGRIIIPTVFEEKWRTWTARSIHPFEKLRYKSCGESAMKPDQLIFDYDNLTGGNILILNEGFFDCARVASTFIPGVHAAALMGKGISDIQIHMLMELSTIYEHVVLILDADAENTKLQYWSVLSWYILNFSFYSPQLGKDYGDYATPECKQEIQQLQLQLSRKKSHVY